jgi:hypothetical protein
VKSKTIGLVAIVATTLCAMLLGSGTASAASTGRFANYGAQQCIVSELNHNIHAGPCTPITRLKQWIWSGKINDAGGTTIVNSGIGNTCLDSNTAGHVYTLVCNGSDNQRWVIIQRAAGSAFLLQNLETRRYLYQNSSNLYSTTDKLDLNSYILRWTVG